MELSYELLWTEWGVVDVGDSREVDVQGVWQGVAGEPGVPGGSAFRKGSK